jgi:predicted DNA-binding transcriptional regulator AlpA
MNVLSVTDVAKKTTLAEQTIRNWASMGKFPRPFKLGGRAVWDETDVNDWLNIKKRTTQGDTNEASGCTRL